MGSKPIGAAYSHAKATGKDQSQSAQRRRANAFLQREGHAPMSRKVAKGILDRWRAMSTDERADEFNLRAAGVPPEVAHALAMTGNGKTPKRQPKFGGLISKMGPTLAELDVAGHTTGLTGSQALRGATWRKRKKKVSKGGPGSGPRPGGGSSVASHLSAASSHLAAAKLARSKGDHATADGHQQKAADRIRAALTVSSVAKAGEFDESKHPRADDGKFGEGSGSASDKHDAWLKEGLDHHELANKHTTAAKKSRAAQSLYSELGNKEQQEFHRGKAVSHEIYAKQLNKGQMPAPHRAVSGTRKPTASADVSASPKDAGSAPSPEQIKSLKAYTDNSDGKNKAYQDMQASMEGTLGKVSARRAAAAKQNADNVNAAIAEHPATEDYTVFRGTAVPADIKVGDKMSTPRIISTSSKPSVARKYMGQASAHADDVAVLKITVKKGTGVLDANAHGISEFEGEQEHMLGSHTQLRVTHIEQTDSGRVIHVEATNPPKGAAVAKHEDVASTADDVHRLGDNLNLTLAKTPVAKRHMVSQLADQFIAAAYEPPRLPAGEPQYTDPPEFARYLDAQRLVAGMDTELSSGAETPEIARTRASRALATSMGHYDRAVAGSDRNLAHVGGLNLDLGSGQARERGFLGVDSYPYDYGTVVADLGMGIPFPDGCARAVRCVNALPEFEDYRDDATGLMLEVQRVLTIGGRFYYQGPPLQDIVDWSKVPAMGVVSHQFGDGGQLLTLTLQRQAARLPVVYGADVQQLGRTEASPADLAQSQAEFGDLPAASVAMANLVAKTHVDVRASIVKKRDWDRVVIGPILVPGIADSQNDVMTAEDIEQTAHNFLADARLVGREHSDTWDGAQVVESYIAPSDLSFADAMYGPQLVPKGSWILGVRIPEESWADVLDGSVTGFSVGGWGEREDLPAAPVAT